MLRILVLVGLLVAPGAFAATTYCLCYHFGCWTDEKTHDKNFAKPNRDIKATFQQAIPKDFAGAFTDFKKSSDEEAKKACDESARKENKGLPKIDVDSIVGKLVGKCVASACQITAFDQEDIDHWHKKFDAGKPNLGPHDSMPK